MRLATISIAPLALTLCACNGDGPTSAGGGTGKIETSEIQMDLDPDGDGIATASLSGNIASMQCELSQPLAEHGDNVGNDAENDDALADVASAMTVTVRSQSGATATLGGGMLVASPPAGAGEWSMTLDSDREVLTLQWFNSTAGGLTMTPGNDYEVMYALGDNCCVENITTSVITFRL